MLTGPTGEAAAAELIAATARVVRVADAVFVDWVCLREVQVPV